MDGTIRLTADERTTALAAIHRGRDHRAARRANVLLLLADGRTVRFVAALFCSADLVAAVRRDYRRGGVPAALGAEPPPVRRVPWWWTRLLVWAVEFTPADFGFRRSRWSCGALAVALRETIGVRVGRETVLPVWWDGGLRIVRWGSRVRRSKLPPTGWTWQASVAAGKWAALHPEPVTVPANYGYTGGVWYRVKEGVHGLLVADPQGEPVVYLVVSRPTRYFQVMTRSAWGPALVGEVI